MKEVKQQIPTVTLGGGTVGIAPFNEHGHVGLVFGHFDEPRKIGMVTDDEDTGMIDDDNLIFQMVSTNPESLLVVRDIITKHFDPNANDMKEALYALHELSKMQDRSYIGSEIHKYCEGLFDGYQPESVD
jgi:hypothetical protein